MKDWQFALIMAFLIFNSGDHANHDWYVIFSTVMGVFFTLGGILLMWRRP